MGAIGIYSMLSTEIKRLNIHSSNGLRVLWRLLFDPFPIILFTALLQILLFLYMSSDNESDRRPAIKEDAKSAIWLNTTGI